MTPGVIHLVVAIALGLAALGLTELSMRRQLRRAVEPFYGRLSREWLLARTEGVFRSRRFVAEYTGTAHPVLALAVEQSSPESWNFQIIRRTPLARWLAPKYRRPLGERRLLLAADVRERARAAAVFDSQEGQDQLSILFDQCGAVLLSVTDESVGVRFDRRGRRVLKRQLGEALGALAACACLVEDVPTGRPEAK